MSSSIRYLWASGEMVPLKISESHLLGKAWKWAHFIDSLDPFHWESKVFEASEFSNALGSHVFRFTWHTIGFCHNAQRSDHGNPPRWTPKKEVFCYVFGSFLSSPVGRNVQTLDGGRWFEEPIPCFWQRRFCDTVQAETGSTWSLLFFEPLWMKCSCVFGLKGLVYLAYTSHLSGPLGYVSLWSCAILQHSQKSWYILYSIYMYIYIYIYMMSMLQFMYHHAILISFSIL